MAYAISGVLMVDSDRETETPEFAIGTVVLASENTALYYDEVASGTYGWVEIDPAFTLPG